jgi:hypothetical protein
MKTSFVILPSILGLVSAFKCFMCVNQQSVQFVQGWIFAFIVEDSKLYAIGGKEKGQGNYVLP